MDDETIRYGVAAALKDLHDLQAKDRRIDRLVTLAAAYRDWSPSNPNVAVNNDPIKAQWFAERTLAAIEAQLGAAPAALPGERFQFCPSH